MTGTREEPWWSSGDCDRLGDEDPFDAHRSARGNAGDVADPLLRVLRQVSEGHRRLDGETCGVCPLCRVIAGLGETRPELVHHLSEAMRHLTLAAKTFVDAQASAHGPTGLQRIEVEDDPRSEPS